MQITEAMDAREMQEDDILRRLGELKTRDEVELTRHEDTEHLLRRMVRESPLRYDFAPLFSGPDEWRLHIRVRDESEPRSVMQYLGWDHDRLDDLLSRGLELARTDRWEDAAPLLQDFRSGLFRHIDIENEILFKAFEEVTGIGSGGPTTVMRHEHVDIKEYVDGILQAAADRNPDELERQHANLLGVLVEHNMKEENILYPATDRALDPASRTRLVEDLLLH